VSEEAAWRRRFRATSMSLPEWARDAPDRLLYVSNESGQYELHAWHRVTGSRRQVTQRPEGTRVGALDPAGELIWWFDDDRGSEFGTWMAERFQGGATPRQAAPGVEQTYGAGLALGRGFAVVGTSTDTGSRVWISTPQSKPEMLYAHTEDAEVAGLSRDERLLAISHSEHGDSRHPALRVLDRRGHAVADLWDGPGLGLVARAWSPVPGDQRLIVIHERTGAERPAIWAPAAGKQVELRLDLPGEVGADWFPDASALLLTHEHAGRSELYRYDLGTHICARLDVPAGSISGARARPDGRVWYRHSGGATPPRLLEDGVQLIELPGPPPPPGKAYADVRVGSVAGFLVEPTGGRPYPTIFPVHGGPASHDQDCWSPGVQAWVDHGFAVVLVNYRGSSGYGRAWRDALQGNPGLPEIEDIKAVRDHLVAAGIVDRRRVVLSGGSWGGYLTLMGLGLQEESWSLGVASVPVADYVAAFEDEMEPLRAFDRALFGGAPAERPELYRERSPITYADRLRVPVLIMAGRNDPRCPIRQIGNYLARLRELGKPYEYYEFDAGHSSAVVEEQIRRIEKRIAFVHRHLGTPPAL